MNRLTEIVIANLVFLALFSFSGTGIGVIQVLAQGKAVSSDSDENAVITRLIEENRNLLELLLENGDGFDVKGPIKAKTTLKRDLSAASKERESLYNEVLTLRQEVEKAKISLAKKDSQEIVPLKDKIRVLAEEIAMAKTQVISSAKVKDSSINKLTQEKQAIQAELKKATGDNASLEKNITSLRNALQEARNSVAAKIEDNKRIFQLKTKEIDAKITEAKGPLEAKIASLEQALKDANASVPEKIKQARLPLEADAAALKLELEKLKASIQDKIKKEKIPLEAKIASLEQMLKELNASVLDKIREIKAPLESY